MGNARHEALKAWDTRLRQLMPEAEIAEYHQEKELNKIEGAARKKVRDIIRAMGGIKDKDYENIPIWARRKNGIPLDCTVIDLAEEGYQVENADDVFNLILESGL